MWITNKLGYDITLSGVTLYKNSQQEISDADATKLNKDAVFTAMITAGTGLVKTDSQPAVNPQYFVRALDAPITLDGMPTNPNGHPMVSPAQAFDIGKEEGGDADLENNKAVTIDVSTYTEPVEVTPTEGKDGMKKATVTLDNIPSGGGGTAYAWKQSDSTVSYFNFNTAPADQANFDGSKIITYDPTGILTVEYSSAYGLAYVKVSDTEITLDGNTWTRDSSHDFTLW